MLESVTWKRHSAEMLQGCDICMWLFHASILFTLITDLMLLSRCVKSFSSAWQLPVHRAVSSARQALTVGAECTIRIEDVTNLGLGVGRERMPDGSKCVVMVPLVLPGETVSVRITKVQKSYSIAELVDVVKPSADRVTPLCSYYSVCGGCQYQHMNITSQRKWKRAQVRTALERIGGLEELVVNDVVGTDHTYAYRSKLAPHYKSKHSGATTIMGFNKRSTTELVDVEYCAIGTDAVNDAFRQRRKSMLHANLGKQSKQLTKEDALLFRETDDGVVTSDPEEDVFSTVNGIRFQHKAGGFFQTNAFVLPLLVEHVVNQAKGDGIEHLVDAYCGVGLFALSAAPHFASVHGVEYNAEAVKAALENAKYNKISNAKFVTGKAQRIFASVSELPSDKTAVVVDPPRIGCEKVFLDHLLKFKPQKIVYVSCDPATQARDAKIITSEGYSAADVTPFDLFPQTRHIENVMTFVKD
jgi:tRNA/tmRNA/rRNA uracil-C5-methylase (TrmA/RlmC/RlmD family)